MPFVMLARKGAEGQFSVLQGSLISISWAIKSGLNSSLPRTQQNPVLGVEGCFLFIYCVCVGGSQQTAVITHRHLHRPREKGKHVNK